MSGWKGLASAFLQTWRAMLRDPAALLLLFGAGVLYSFFYPLPYAHETVRQVPIVVVDEDRTALSRQLARFAAAHPSVRLQEVTADVAQAQDRLWRGEAAGVLFIPQGLRERALAGRRAEVQVAGNGVYLMVNKVALNGLAEAVGTASAGIEVRRLATTAPSTPQVLAQREPVALAALPLFNVREGYGSYVVPAVAVLVIQQTLLMAACLLFGTWFEHRSAPLPRTGAAYFGMLCAFASVVAINSLYYFGFVLWWQDYPRGGNPGGMLLFVLLFAFCVAAYAAMLGTLFRTRERSLQLLIATAMPLLFLSGVSWPVEALPPVLQGLRWLVPSTAGIQGFVALNQLGAQLAEVRVEAVALLLLGLASGSLGLARWLRGRPGMGNRAMASDRGAPEGS